MGTNFHFLASEWGTFFERATKAEQLVITDPRASLAYSRMALELAVNWMYSNDEELTSPYDTSLNSLITDQVFKEQFNHKLYNEIHLIRKAGNLALHNKRVSDVDSHTVIEYLFYFAKWFAKSYAKEVSNDIGLFDWDLIPKEGHDALTKKQLAQLQDKLDTEKSTFQKRLADSAEKNRLLEEKNELFRKQLEALQEQIEANKAVANTQDEVHHPRNEYETRKYFIDVLLREAGWDLAGIKDKEFKVQYMPKSTNTSETGYVDYVLWDDDGLPLALVEAKKTLESVSKGENQAQLYADSLEKMYGRRPVMYYSNGFETYLWDDQFYKRSRPVHGFYTKQELQTLKKFFMK